MAVVSSCREAYG